MSETEEFSHPTRDGERDVLELEMEQSVRQIESRRTQLGVLIGSGILQLPIWGFAMSYGVFQQYYFDNWALKGDRSVTGVIGTTANGVMYLSMPLLFALFTRRWAHRRQLAALCGTVIACASFFLSSYSTTVGHLLATQGIVSALGCALVYSPTTLSLGEWYSTGNRALAYGIVLSCKNIVGTGCPFLLRALIDHYGFRTTLKAWTAIVGGTSILGIFLIPTHPSKVSIHQTRARKIPWEFLRHRSIYFYSIAIIFQSSGYGIPQTYLSTYARDITMLSQTSGTLMLALFNAPGIIASSFFGWLSDNKRVTLSTQAVSSIPPICCTLATFLFWGLTTQGSLGLLIIFSMTFGFFSGGYSATWGGMLKQMEHESAERNEPVDPGMLYGLLNGVRGIGYASGGFAGMELLNAGTISASSRFGYGTSYGPLILFTGLSSLLGGSKSWSYNTLKARSVLNFKGIPYTQSWVSYPDIKLLGASLGLPPNPQGRAYTLPTIVHKPSVTSTPSGAITDSIAIALHLDKAFPSPPLFPSGDASYALFVAVAKIITLIEPGFRPYVVPRVPAHLDERGKQYFTETRSVALGKPLHQVLPTDKETIDKLWKLVETESAPLVKMLKGREQKKGPFFEGEKAGFADLWVACHLAFIERFDKELFGKILGLGNGELKALYEACLPWVEGQGEEKEWPIPQAA
ncbi:Putative inner membrane metabolite transport protein YdfJ [Talaromyces islandicus]|uniref:Putative inner membrane metabolite transport protein YdfJ n=1 Tax=Talaromyces islandicus TaxID=28573 RepID=A0A0U1LTZ9_TALIS|nr:Putative inner membrane metabolite transport protein YdfJ [Talaromyces islandicus]